MSAGYIFKLRRDTAARWVEQDPVLSEGEPGFEKDTGRLKIGNGVNTWTELPYFIPGQAALLAHINSEDPHPVYDDGRAFDLLYANAKV